MRFASSHSKHLLILNFRCKCPPPHSCQAVAWRCLTASSSSSSRRVALAVRGQLTTQSCNNSCTLPIRPSSHLRRRPPVHTAVGRRRDRFRRQVAASRSSGRRRGKVIPARKPRRDAAGAKSSRKPPLLLDPAHRHRPPRRSHRPYPPHCSIYASGDLVTSEFLSIICVSDVRVSAHL